MDIFIKASSSIFGSDTGDIFSISADFGSATPNQINKNELISGKIISVDQNTSKLIISSGGICSNQVEVIINKDDSACYSTRAASYRLGNKRPTDENYAISAFKTEEISLAKIEEIRNAQEYQQFSFDIFGISINCIVDFTDTNEENGDLIKSGTGSSSFGSFNFAFIESLDGNLTLSLISNNTNVSYKITGSPSSGYVAEEWLTTDFISF